MGIVMLTENEYKVALDKLGISTFYDKGFITDDVELFIRQHGNGQLNSLSFISTVYHKDKRLGRLAHSKYVQRRDRYLIPSRDPKSGEMEPMPFAGRKYPFQMYLTMDSIESELQTIIELFDEVANVTTHGATYRGELSISCSISSKHELRIEMPDMFIREYEPTIDSGSLTFSTKIEFDNGSSMIFDLLDISKPAPIQEKTEPVVECKTQPSEKLSIPRRLASLFRSPIRYR